ncbi:hypothetical protein PVK06_016951 [Gossypium arboreum]|uniref:Retrotransposon gag domain-containing protein n=1 Tax=Gossypium arboreum TaxID=29729 RepID=A0ABR0Q2I6_GOSAR|nr:hypothetical protein PVK06_016951 [Gossypium arboreum]
MTRSEPTTLEFEPKLEKLARQLRKEANKRGKRPNLSFETISYTEKFFSFDEPNKMAEQTIRQLAAAPDEQQPLCLTYPVGGTSFDLKSSFIHLLPTFRGLQNENSHTHLKEFHMVCTSMKPQGVIEDQIKLCAFPFLLADSAIEWLFYLPSGSVNTWSDMSRVFLDMFFPAT